ncbi:hypothetical protein OZX68_03920 [Streptococcaceae bacterium ESL0729]|nr:hypothetical protein OZX68_03920 [Streptococcaceae bacterium ESL0729]
MKIRLLISLLVSLLLPLPASLASNLAEIPTFISILVSFLVVYLILLLLKFLNQAFIQTVYQYLEGQKSLTRSRKFKGTYISLRSQRELVQQFYSPYDYILDHPYIVDKSGSQGALIYLTKKKLASHASQRKFTRLPNPPGWEKIDNSRVGQVYPYHRTHLLPFIFSQSEGLDMPFLLITGSSYLNHGDLLSLDIVTSHDKRERHSIHRRAESIRINNREQKLLVNRPTLDATFEGNLRYSLADIEAFASEYIKKSKGRHVFCYMVVCNYDKDPLIPASVNIFFQNVSQKRTILNMELENIHL